ncbi:hypothetical protein BDZ91DRAFT_786079 [Kalaharituber pfeilii]|nr:hypothetical protein BDZ91DRAFT_786079 [Kalaharituber pfeilii]
MTDTIPTDIDWINDVCLAGQMMLTQSGNTLYAIGGYQILDRDSNSIERTNPRFSSSYLYILDFSKIDNLRNDYASVITAQRLPDEIPRVVGGGFFARKGRLHLFGGARWYSSGGLWTYEIAKNEWLEKSDSGLGLDTVALAASAYDVEGEVGWLYGGVVYPEGKDTVDLPAKKALEVLMRVPEVSAAEEVKVEKVQTDSPIVVGQSQRGNMVFIRNIGTEGNGVLVLLGGKVDDSFISLQNVFVYDIATHTWFNQSTTSRRDNFPSARVQSCAVVASAPDGSSHNIYFYGGHDARGQSFWNLHILSLPSFHWVNIDGIGDAYNRFDAACAKVHDKYMVVYRGIEASGDHKCDSNAGIQLFDLSTLEWTTKIDVQADSEKGRYKVPKQLYDVIGGDGEGDATFTFPEGGFEDNRLYRIFNVSANSNHSTTISSSPAPKTLSPGVIAGIILAGCAFLVFISIVSFKYLPHLVHSKGQRSS